MQVIEKRGVEREEEDGAKGAKLGWVLLVDSAAVEALGEDCS